MKVLVQMDKEPSKENYVDILRSGNELLRSNQNPAATEETPTAPKQDAGPRRLLGFGRKIT